MTGSRPPGDGQLLVALSNAMVAIYKELYGKGPVKVRTWYLDDVVLCVLRGGLTHGEHTFVDIGRSDQVARQRDSFHVDTEPVFVQKIEELTGRRVKTVLDANSEEDDVSILVFLLETAEGAAARLGPN